VLLIPVACSVAGNALGSTSTFQSVLAGVLTAFVVFSAIYTNRSARLARRFLTSDNEVRVG
jgi:hypothetical protein